MTAFGYLPLLKRGLGLAFGAYFLLDTEIQKFEYLENEESFLDEIKSIFHSYLKAIIWWKNEK